MGEDRERSDEKKTIEDYTNKTARSLCITGYIAIAVGVIFGIIILGSVPGGWIIGLLVAFASVVLCMLLNGVAETIELLEKIHKKLP